MPPHGCLEGCGTPARLGAAGGGVGAARLSLGEFRGIELTAFGFQMINAVPVEFGARHIESQVNIPARAISGPVSLRLSKICALVTLSVRQAKIASPLAGLNFIDAQEIHSQP